MNFGSDNINEAGTSENEDPALSRMMADLPRATAPDDLEAAVLRTIRTSDEGGRRTSGIFSPAWAAAALLVIAICVGAFLMLRGSGEQQTAAAGDTSLQQSPASAQKTGIDPQKAADESTAAKSDQADVSNTRPPLKNDRAADRNTDNAGQTNSQDMAITSANKPMLPKGLEPDGKQAADARVAGRSSIEEALEFLGVSARCGASGCLVSDVKHGSMAESMGLVKGDLIIEVDGKPVHGDAQFTGTVSMKRFTVMRGGRRYAAEMKPR